LLNENRELIKKVSSLEEKSSLFRRNEEAMYEGELADVLLYAVNEAMPHVNPEVNKRRADVLKDIMENNEISKTQKTKKKELKNLLENYTHMTGALERDLQLFGFTIDKSGKHYKLIYKDDPKYTFILAKTPSDVKGSKSKCELISRTLF
jgi:hypothetical protein